MTSKFHAEYYRARNCKIYEMYKAGNITLRELAGRFDITHQRIWQICQQQKRIEQGIGDDIKRMVAIFRGVDRKN